MQPLKDIRVLSVTVYLAGPFLSMTMARFGAEVIKIETPGRGDPIRLNGPFAGPKGVHPTRQIVVERRQGIVNLGRQRWRARGGGG